MNYNDIFIESKLPKPLKKEELFEYIRQAREGNLEARDKVITHNIKLVLNQVLKKFANAPYEKKDLVSIGTIGLVKAVDTFDITKKFDFSTYAIRCINNEIYMFLRQVRKTYNLDSLDKIISTDKVGHEMLLKDKVSDDYDMEEEYVNEEVYQIIRKIVDALPTREQEIIKMYFGFYDNKLYKQHEIAEMFNLSQSYVCRLIKKIVNKIALELVEKGIVEGRNEQLSETNTFSEFVLHEKKKLLSFM